MLLKWPILLGKVKAKYRFFGKSFITLTSGRFGINRQGRLKWTSNGSKFYSHQFMYSTLPCGETLQLLPTQTGQSNVCTSSLKIYGATDLWDYVFIKQKTTSFSKVAILMFKNTNASFYSWTMWPDFENFHHFGNFMGVFWKFT